MAIYYFNLHECGTPLLAEEGVEFPDLEAAREEAVRAARDVMASEMKEGRLCLSCCIMIEDAERVEIARVDFRDAVAISGLTPPAP